MLRIIYLLFVVLLVAASAEKNGASPGLGNCQQYFRMQLLAIYKHILVRIIWVCFRFGAADRTCFLGHRDACLSIRAACCLTYV